jgi:hypothetical protein
MVRASIRKIRSENVCEGALRTPKLDPDRHRNVSKNHIFLRSTKPRSTTLLY